MFEQGLEWIRADFHLHTRKDKEFTYSGEENSFVKEYIDELYSKNINIGVITNHNKFDEGEYKALRKAGKKKGILILPGVELSVKEGNGIHTLIVFKSDDWLFEGDNFIEHFLKEAFAGIANYENRNTRCKFDLRNVIETLNGYGKDYFIILAHVDQKNGFFECSDSVMSDIKETADFANRVIGVQKLRKRESLARFHRCFGYYCACVEGSDPKSMDQIGKGDCVYIKTGNLSYDAVKFALMDFSNRVVCKDKPKTTHGYIKSISFVGGRLDGTTIELSPELNTFIGIRGSGKSSALEVLRYALDLKPSCDVEYKNKLVDITLGSGGQVIVKVVDKYENEYEIRRIVKEKTSIVDANDKDLGISIDTILHNILYFGQKDLSQGASFEAELLDKLLGDNIKSSVDDISNFYEEMSESLKSLLAIKNIPDEISDLETTKSNLNHKIHIFEEKGIAEKLSKQTAFDLDRQKINEIRCEIEKTIKDIKDCLNKITINVNMFNEYNSEYNAKEIEEAKGILSTIIQIIENMKRETDTVDGKHAEYKSILKSIDVKIESLKGEFAEIKRQINDPQEDIEAYPELKIKLQETEGQLKKLSDSLTGKNIFENSFRKALRNRNELLQKQFKLYETAVKKINDSQTELLVQLGFKGDKEKFKEYLKSDFRGSSIKDTKYQSLVDNFSDYAALIEDVLINGGVKCKEHLTETEYIKLREKIEVQYQDLLIKETPNSVEMFYHNKPLKQHSLGQRTSALVLFILAQKENDVVIIDQPEDDLDNKVIYDEVIKSICSRKKDIQFIFATHNANIPVLGDAEKILVAELSDDVLKIDQGNIDAPKTHNQIVSIMEGGQEAFDKRKKIYSSWG